MPEVISTTVYQLDELSRPAATRARDWYRTALPDADWSEFVLEDFERISAILGVDLRTTSVRLYGGGTRRKPCIWYSGFSNQGDGACFEGSYRYATGATHAIRAAAPLDAELHRIADALAAIQRRNFYQLEADIRHQGRYYHEYTITIAVDRVGPTAQAMTPDAGDAISELLRDLARWLYARLEQAYDYETSDAVVDEGILANEYSFTDQGERFP